MRRTFILQLYDRLDPDVCITPECQGPAPNPTLTPSALLAQQCEPCARRRLGLSSKRSSGYWRTQPKESHGGGRFTVRL